MCGRRRPVYQCLSKISASANLTFVSSGFYKFCQWFQEEPETMLLQSDGVNRAGAG